MKEIESIASALFDKIRSRFTNVTLGDEKAEAEQDPEKARFFNFVYSDESGTEFGTVTMSLIDEESLKVYFGVDITRDMDQDQRKEWYEFLRNLRKFAKRNLLTFDTRDITKSNLELQDIKQQSKVDDVATQSDVAVTESKLYGTPGRPYTSFADKGNTKILIRHKKKIDDEVRGSRARQIQEIFLETERGERFLLGHTNLHGAFAMAEHLNQGGTMHDERANCINTMVEEMNAMRHFVRSTKNRQFEDSETDDMTRAAVHHYDQIKRTLRQMRGARGYRSYFENWKPSKEEAVDVDIDALRERFVKKVYDDRFTDALPIVYKAYKKQTPSDEFAEWAESIYEEMDSISPEEQLSELLQGPIVAGVDGIDAITELQQAIGSHKNFEQLKDAIHNYVGRGASGQGPDADVSGVVKVWAQKNFPNLGVDTENEYIGQASPQISNPNDYGATGMDWPQENPTIKESDGLEFIRTLAGLKK